MRKIEYILSNERLITPSGLSLVGQVLGKSNLVKKANRMRTEKRSQPQIKNGDILLTIIGAAAMKGNDMPVRHSTIKRRKIRTVIDNLILLAGHLTDHARKLRLALGHSNGWICTLFE